MSDLNLRLAFSDTVMGAALTVEPFVSVYMLKEMLKHGWVNKTLPDQNKTAGKVVLTLKPSTREIKGRWISNFKVSLVFLVSSKGCRVRP